MIEAALMCWFLLAGIGLTSQLRGSAALVTRVALSFPVGVGAYLLVGWALLVARLPFSPLLVIGLVSVAAVTLAVRTREPPSSIAVAGVVGAVVVAALSLVFQALPLARVTPDSIRFLVAAGAITQEGTLAAVLPHDLYRRQIIEALFHSPAALVGSPFLPSITPVFGVTAVAATLALGDEWARRRSVPRPWRAVVLVAAVALLGSANRPVFNLFYIHGHMLMAFFFALAVVAAWLAVVTGDGRWETLVPPALALVVATRPEGFLVASLLVVPLVASPAVPERLRWWSTGVTAGVVAVWFTVVVRPVVHRDFTSLVYGALMVAVVLVVLAVARRARPLRAVVRLAPHALVAVLVVALVGAAYLQPDIAWETFSATWTNVTGRGGWGVTWLGLPLLLVVVIAVVRLPAASIWWTPLLGFLPLALLLAFLRGRAYRVGVGDSGNRMLMHILLVAVAYLVVAATAELARSRGAVGRSEEAPRTPH